MTSHIWCENRWLTKSCNLCWKGIRRTPTYGVILKTNVKSIKNWNELLVVCSLETNDFNVFYCQKNYRFPFIDIHNNIVMLFCY